MSPQISLKNIYQYAFQPILLFQENFNRPICDIFLNLGKFSRVVEFWKNIDAFKTSLEINKDKPLYTFYDGPPFATGLPHYGHILAGTIKDTVTRWAHQTGHNVERRFGWDCHGVPVEFEIDKKGTKLFTAL